MLKLGWRWPRPNDFQSNDQRPLRDTFGSLQQFLTFPHVGLRFDGTFNLAGALAPVPFTVHSAVASPFVSGDTYNLYRPGTSQIQVPRDFDTWLAIGVASFLTTAGDANALRTYAWRRNSVNDVWMTQSTRATAGAARGQASIVLPVRKGDVLDICAASSSAAESVTDAEAWVVFLPLT